MQRLAVDVSNSEVSMAAVIEVHSLRQTYEDVVAVDGVSFEVAVGEIFAGMGHAMMLDVGRQAVADRIIDWLAAQGL
jgi:ABC-type uncharacterized transport system ATPase subunit